jgi:hypothetical protein
MTGAFKRAELTSRSNSQFERTVAKAHTPLLSVLHLKYASSCRSSVLALVEDFVQTSKLSCEAMASLVRFRAHLEQKCPPYSYRGRRRTFRAASRDTTTVPLPVNLYDLLRVPKVRHPPSVDVLQRRNLSQDKRGLVQDASIEDCRQAYDRMLQDPADAGYSRKCLADRRSLLESAANILLDTKSRSSYASECTEVEYTSLPGAIALLQVCLFYTSRIDPQLSY